MCFVFKVHSETGSRLQNRTEQIKYHIVRFSKNRYIHIAHHCRECIKSNVSMCACSRRFLQCVSCQRCVLIGHIYIEKPQGSKSKKKTTHTSADKWSADFDKRIVPVRTHACLLRRESKRRNFSGWVRGECAAF